MRKKIFFTSDWHLGHFNCLEFDKRPFNSTGEMEEKIIKRFNAVVPKYALTYVLGDVGRKVDLNSFLDKLNGEKVLVLGNHDYKMYGMYNRGFKFVVNTCSIEIAKKIVTMSHCPLLGVWREDVSDYKHSIFKDSWHREHANARFSVPDFGQFHLHGHTHLHKNEGVRTNRQWDVGVVGNDYTPVSMGQVEKWIEEIKRRENVN